VLTFDKYARVTFTPFVTGTLSNTSRMDIVWDDDQLENLEEATRQKRGTGVRKKVPENLKMPRNWSFLGDAANKKELCQFLTVQVSRYSFPADKNVVITSGKD